MKKFLSVFFVALLSFGLSVHDADAKRFGGGGNIGKQRTMSAPQQNNAAPAKPAQAPAATPKPTPAPTPAPASGMSKWLGPLAGLAAGGLLASMFMGGGLGGLGGLASGIGSILMILALVAAAVFIFRMVRKPQPQPMQYAGMGENTVMGMVNTGGTSTPPATQPEPFKPLMPSAEPAFTPVMQADAVAAPAAPSTRPAWFEDEPFLREAQKHFIRLQADYDSGDLADIREYVTGEMYAEIVMQLKERGATVNKTEVVKLDAAILEVVTENDHCIASVRFYGLIREEVGGSAEPFDEIWNIQKSLSQPNATWFVAGIQQTA
ncbi:MAG: TIM44-like domain-containing protein [Sulfuricella sp.]|nr:TIM44-like domain-containing protein [Sulfuricella sp.]